MYQAHNMQGSAERRKMLRKTKRGMRHAVSAAKRSNRAARMAKSTPRKGYLGAIARTSYTCVDILQRWQVLVLNRTRNAGEHEKCFRVPDRRNCIPFAI